MTTPTPTPPATTATPLTDECRDRTVKDSVQEMANIYVLSRQLERDLTAALATIERQREALEDVSKQLAEMPRMILANEKLNPSWSKAELWGIERDIIPSIRALCLAAQCRIDAALTPPAPSTQGRAT